MWTVCEWQFTRREYGAPIPPGKEATFEYMFRPDPKLDANEYPLSADVVYMGKVCRQRSDVISSPSRVPSNALRVYMIVACQLKHSQQPLLFYVHSFSASHFARSSSTKPLS